MRRIGAFFEVLKSLWCIFQKLFNKTGRFDSMKKFQGIIKAERVLKLKSIKKIGQSWIISLFGR